MRNALSLLAVLASSLSSYASAQLTSSINFDIITAYYVSVTYSSCSGGPVTTTLDVVPSDTTTLKPLTTRTSKDGKFTTLLEEIAPTDLPSADFTSSSVAFAPFSCTVYKVATQTASPNAPCNPLPFPPVPTFRCSPSNPCCKGCQKIKQSCLIGHCGDFPTHVFECPDGLEYNVGGSTLVAGQTGAKPTNKPGGSGGAGNGGSAPKNGGGGSASKSGGSGSSGAAGMTNERGMDAFGIAVGIWAIASLAGCILL